MPEDVGLSLNTPEAIKQPVEHAENRGVSEGSHPHNDDFVVPPDVQPMPENVFHWIS